MEEKNNNEIIIKSETQDNSRDSSKKIREIQTENQIHRGKEVITTKGIGQNLQGGKVRIKKFQ